MNAKEFISYLESKQLLESVILDQLRKLISSTNRAITPEELVKLLVDEGHLTRFQGSRILTELPVARDEPDAGDELAIKHVDSLDGDLHVTPEPDPQPVAEEPIVDLTSSGDEDEEIVELEQAVAAPLPAPGNDPLLDPLSKHCTCFAAASTLRDPLPRTAKCLATQAPSACASAPTSFSCTRGWAP